jgi:hypothetical protein
MPLYVYRLQPALAVAFAARYLPGEWVLSLRARSEAMSAEMRLTPEQAESLWRALAGAREWFAGGRFPLCRATPCPPDHPLLRLPYDLEAEAQETSVVRREGRRALGIEVRGRVDGFPFLVEIWGTPEQLLALGEQMESVCRQVGSLCPVCGRAIAEGSHDGCIPVQ